MFIVLKALGQWQYKLKNLIIMKSCYGYGFKNERSKVNVSCASFGMLSFCSPLVCQ